MLVSTPSPDAVADAAMCANGTAMGKRIAFATRPQCSKSENDDDKTQSKNNCDVGSDDSNGGGRGGITVNGGSKVYIASGLLITKGTIFYVGSGGMNVNTKTWSVLYHPPPCVRMHMDV